MNLVLISNNVVSLSIMYSVFNLILKTNGNDVIFAFWLFIKNGLETLSFFNLIALLSFKLKS